MQEIIQFINKHPILILAWLMFLGALIFNVFQGLLYKAVEITHHEAIRLINKEDALIVDLRRQNEFYKGHIINSLNLTASEIKLGNLGKLEQAKNKPIILVYNNIIMSHDLVKQLNKLGFNQIYILKEGISGWIDEKLPLFIK